MYLQRHVGMQADTVRATNVVGISAITQSPVGVATAFDFWTEDINQVSGEGRE